MAQSEQKITSGRSDKDGWRMQDILTLGYSDVMSDGMAAILL